MNKTEKIIIIFYIFLASSFLLTILYIDYTIKRPESIGQMEEAKRNIQFTKTVDIDKKSFFNLVTDVKDYPIIIPQNVISVKIINQTNSTIFAEEELAQYSLKTKFIAKHTIIPYEKYTTEILSGDAKGTIVTLTFEGVHNSTMINVDCKFNFQGNLKLLALSPGDIIEGKLDDVINNFIDYSKGFDSTTKKTIDDLYREILHRPADVPGLKYYISMLESKKMTIDDIRKALMESPEKRQFLEFDERKTIDELQPETKKTIDGLYQEILHRHADKQGLETFGSLLESKKMTIDDIRKALMDSEEKRLYDERKTIDELQPETKKTIDGLYQEILHRHADQKGLEYYGSLLESKKMTVDDIRKALMNSPEYATIR